MRNRKAFFFLSLLFIFLPVLVGKEAFSGREDCPRILILPFQASGGNEENSWAGIGLAEYLNLSLKESKGPGLIDDNWERKKVFPGKQPTDQKIMEIGEIFGADKAVWGSFQLSKDKITIIPRITDIKTGLTRELTRQKGNWKEIFSIEERMLKEILFILKGNLGKEGKEKIRALMPQSPLAYEHYLKGRYYLLEKKDYSHALIEFNKAITLEPGYSLAWAFIGKTYLTLADSENSKCMVEKAKKASKKALTGVSDLALARENLAVCCFHQKDFVRAEKELETAIALNPRNAETRFLLGTIYQRQRKFDRAINEYQQAIKIDPHYPEVHHELCMVYYGQSKPDLAEEEGSLALKEDPVDPNIHFILGNIYFDMDRWDRAAAEYQKVQKIDPRYPNIHYSMAMSYHRGGEMDLAIEEYQKAIEASNINRARFNRGTIYYHKGDLNSAKKDFRAFLKTNPTCKKCCLLAHNCLGAIYHQEGRLDLAEEQYRKVFNFNPQSSEAHYHLGTIYYQQGKYYRAIKEYREALRLNPNYKEAHFNLALVLERSREYPEAIKHFKRFISLASSYDDKLIEDAREQIRLLKEIQE